MDASTAQSRLTPQSPSQKKFFEKFKATLSDEGFKAFAESNPAKARELVDKAVAELISKSKTNKQKSTALAQRAEAMIKGHGYAFKKGGIIKASLGQQLRNFWGGVTNGVKYLSTPEGLRDLESGTRYVLGDMYNQRSADRTISSIKKSVDLSKPITPTEHYTPNVINAGNAERKLASGQFQYHPAATSDSNQYQAWKKQGYDQGNLHLANAIGLDSEQAATNLLRNIEERRNYAYNRTEGMNAWRKTAAAGESAIGEALNTADRARIESLNQMIYQRQAQRDEDKKAALAYAEKKIAWETQQKIQSELDRRLKEAFPDDKPYDASNEEHRKTREAILREVQAMYQNANFDNEYNLLSPGEQRYYNNWISPALKRKGGSLRPASEQIAINREKSKDQIRVNKAKSQDRIWEASLKDARKALDKMSDRTHKIIMKLLS